MHLNYKIITRIKRNHSSQFNYQGRFTRYSRAAAILLVMLSWIWSFLMALPPFLGWGTFSIEDNGMTVLLHGRIPRTSLITSISSLLGSSSPSSSSSWQASGSSSLSRRWAVSWLQCSIPWCAAYEWNTRWNTEGRSKEEGEENI